MIFAAVILLSSGCDRVRALLPGAAEWQVHEVHTRTESKGGTGDAGPEVAPEVIEPGARVEASEGARRVLAFSNGAEFVLQPGAVVELGRSASPSLRVQQGKVWVQSESMPLELSLGEGVSLRVQGAVTMVRHGEEAEVMLQRGQATLRLPAWLGQGPTHELRYAQPVRVRDDGTLVNLPARGLEHLASGGLEERAMGEALPRVAEIEGRYSRRASKTIRADRERLDVQVEIRGPVAHTEIVETFINRHPEPVAVAYRFQPPPGAQVIGVAVDDTTSGWEEFSVVAREFEDPNVWASHPDELTATGPGERFGAGGTFSGEELLPGQRLRVRFAYVQVMSAGVAGYRYALPLGDADASVVDATFEMNIFDAPPEAVRVWGYEATLGALDDDAEGRGTHVTLRDASFQERDDLVVEVDVFEQRPPLSAQVYADPTRPDEEAFLLLSARPGLTQDRTRRKAGQMLLVFDTSYRSKGALLEPYARLGRALVEQSDPDGQVAALGCATRCEVLGPGWVGAGDEALIEALSELEMGGAHNTLEALRASAEIARHSELRRDPDDHSRPIDVVYLSDAYTTLGALEIETTIDEMAPIFDELGVRLHVVNLSAFVRSRNLADGGAADHPAQRRLARALGGGEPVDIATHLGPIANAWRVIERVVSEPIRDVEVQIEGPVTMVPLRDATSLQPGEALMMYGRLPRASIATSTPLQMRLTGRLRGEPWEWTSELRLATGHEPAHTYLPALWASAEVDHLAYRNPGFPEPIVARVQAISTRYALSNLWASWWIARSPGGVSQLKPGRLPESRPVRHARLSHRGSIDVPARLQSQRAPRYRPSPEVLETGPPPAPGTSALVLHLNERLARGEEPREAVRERNVHERPGYGPRGAHYSSPDARRRALRHHARYSGAWMARQLEDWLRQEPLSPEGLMIYSQHLAWHGEFERARLMLERAIDGAPDVPLLHEVLAAGHESAGHPALACAHRQSLRSLREREARERAPEDPPGALKVTSRAGVGDCPLSSDLSALGVPRQSPDEGSKSPTQSAPPGEVEPGPNQARVVLRAPPGPGIDTDSGLHEPLQLLVVQAGYYGVGWEYYPRGIVAFERSIRAGGERVIEAIVEVAPGVEGDDDTSLLLYARGASGGKALVQVAGEEAREVAIPEPPGDMPAYIISVVPQSLRYEGKTQAPRAERP